MKKIVKILSAVFAMSAVFCICFTSNVFAEIHQGDFGEGLHWTVDTETETLTLSGHGEYPWMETYPFDRFSYKHLVLEDGITFFPYIPYLLETITIGQDVRPSKYSGAYSADRYILNPKNPYFSLYDGCLYSKNYDTLYSVPYSVNEKNERSQRDVWKLHPSIKTIADNSKPLKAYELSSSNPHYSVYDGALFSKDLKTLYHCPSEKQDLQFPAATRVLERGSLVTETTVIIPEGITTWKLNAAQSTCAVLPNSMVNFEKPTEGYETELTKDTMVIFSAENKAAKEYFGNNPWATVIPQEVLELYQAGKWKGWQTVNGHTYYFDHWRFPAKDWLQVGDYWYYFQPETYILLKGFQRVDGKAYFLGTTGAREHDKWKSHNGDWYYLNSWGAGVVKCWKQSGNKWYYMQTDGTMAKNKWVQWYNKWYYVGADGAMYTNRKTPDGYWVNGSGVWVK